MRNIIKKSLILSVITLGIGLFYTPVSASALQVDSLCAPVEIVFARGSGQDVDADEYKRFVSQLTHRLSSNINIHPYELGLETYDGAQYKAAKVTNEGALTGLGAFFSAGYAFEYGDSVKGGIKEFKKYVTDRHAKCPNSRIIVGGYSQGAQVVRTAVKELPTEVRSVIDYTALFGDPKLFLPEGIGILPTACLGIYSPWRQDVPDCHTYQGSLMADINYVPTDMALKTGLWCNARDLICGEATPPPLLEPHFHYKDAGGPIDKAAQKIAAKLKTTIASELAGYINIEWRFKTGSAGLDTVFVIDTTGSMSGRINQAKEFARQSAAKIKENNGRVALVAYKDSGDTYTAQVMSGLQSDQTDFLAKLDSLTASGGGDTPEALLHALKTAFDGLSWKNGATKAAVVLTDAGYHDPDKVDGSTVASVVKRSLEIDPVNVYPVIPSYLNSNYQDLADRTAGQIIQDTGDTVGALTTALTKIINRPVAILKNTEYLAKKDQTVHFNASDSYVVDATITGYDWDFNGDGVFDQHTAEPTVDHTYTTDFDGLMQVRVSADNATIASASATVKIGAPADAAARVVPAPPTNLKVTAASTTATTATLTWNASDGKADKWVIAVDDMPAGTVEKTRGSVEIRDLDRSRDISFAVAGMAADGTIGEYAIVKLAKTPASPCGTSNSIPDMYCRASWTLQQQYLQAVQSFQQYYSLPH